MTGKEAIFGVHFTADGQVDTEEVKKDFGKYGRIIFVKQIMRRVYVNFMTMEEAENCLSDSPNSKYGEIQRGKFGMCEVQNSKDINSNQSGHRRTETYTFSKKTSKNDWKINSSIMSDSEPDNISVISNGRRSQDDPRCREFQAIPDSRSMPRPRTSVSHESKCSSSNGPPPLLSVNDGPPPLLSVNDGPPPLQSFDNGPPPLISAEKADPRSARSSFNGPNRRPPLLPTPSQFLNRHFNPEHMKSHSSHKGFSSLTVDEFENPPPLVSAVSRSVDGKKEYTSSSKISSSLSYEDYVEKYGHFILIINIPEDITGNEIEKILYPHIPVNVSDLEITNVRMKLLYCLVTFKSKTEATKAAKQLDGVEVRGQCLSMIRLDELILMSDVTF